MLQVAMQVASGPHHIVCVTDDGAVFAFGLNIHGQLGVRDRENMQAGVDTAERRAVGELRHKSVVHIYCS